MEILTCIARDVADISNCKFGAGSMKKSIWMTKDLFNRLFPEQYIIIQEDNLPHLFGCTVRVMFFPYAGLYWIVGLEGKIQEDNK